MKKFLSTFMRYQAHFKERLEMRKIIMLFLVVLILLMPDAVFADGQVIIGPDPLTITISGDLDPEEVRIEVIYCSGSTEVWQSIPEIPYTIHFPAPFLYLQVFYEDFLAFTISRDCEPTAAEPIQAEPLFTMWLLTRGDQGCILLSETHPSVERQKALCFPATDPNWIADNAPCADYVYDNGTDYGHWSCDAFGFARLPLHDKDGPDLWEVWQRHATR
jgi:hypothetical protein